MNYAIFSTYINNHMRLRSYLSDKIIKKANMNPGHAAKSFVTTFLFFRKAHYYKIFNATLAIDA